MKLKFSFISFIISSSFIVSCSCHKENIDNVIKNKYEGEDYFDNNIEEVNSGYSKINNAFSVDNFYNKYCNKIEASEGINTNFWPTSGSPNILVIPIAFKDVKLEEDNQTILSNIDAVINKEDKVEYESLCSYYKKSSFGKLDIKATISDIYTSKETFESLNNAGNSSLLSDQIVVDATKWYFENNTNYSTFDINNDKYFDSIICIYLAPYNGYNDITYNNSSLFWAYVKSIYNIDSYIPKTDIRPGTYLWCSYYFLKNKNKELTARTIIHETGHLLSLSDYYSLHYIDEKLEQSYKPLGDVDMMVGEVYDHNCYSKFVLDWTKPYLIDKEGSITISSSSINGDCLLIPTSSYNNSSADEYLLLEYFTPTNLNEHDSKNVYIDRPKTPQINKSGIKLYHVDSRIGLFSYMDGDDLYIKDIANFDTSIITNSAGSKYVDYIYTNTPSGYGDSTGAIYTSYNRPLTLPDYDFGYEDYRLISIITPEGYNYSTGSKYFTNDSLFKNKGYTDFKDKTFLNQFPKETFNNGSPFKYNFKIDSMTKDKCKITFTAI